MVNKSFFTINILRTSTKNTNLDNIQEELLATHHTPLGVLNSRLTKLKVVRNIWSKGNFKGALEAAIKMNDHAILVDILKLFIVKKDLFTNEICNLLFPALRDLFYSQYEEYIETGMNVLRQLLKNIGALIKTIRDTNPRGSVDVEKLEQSNLCYQVISEVKQHLLHMKKVKKGSKLSSSARDFLSSPELNQFFK